MLRTAILCALVLASPVASAADIELVHQGRLLDSGGVPLQGDQRITITLYNHESLSGVDNVLHSEVFPTLPVSDGYYSVRLGADPIRRLDSQVFANPFVYLSVSVSDTPIGERERLHHVPWAAYASVAGSAPLDDSGTVGTPCSPVGALNFDTTLDTLKVCTSEGWAVTGSASGTIIAEGSGREYADGTHARSCNEYLNPTPPYRYAGLTGDGAYTIDPDGFATGVDPFTVTCDMTGGGWTILEHDFVGETIPDRAVEGPSQLYQRLTYSPSDAQILALLQVVSETRQFFRKDCRDSLINQDYGGSYTRFELPDGSFVISTQALWGGGSRRDCDLNDTVDRTQQIVFTNTPNIPIMALWGGDSGDPIEVSTFQIGAFEAR